MSDETVVSPPQVWLDALDKGLAAHEAGLGSPWPEARARLVALQDRLKAEIKNRRA